MRFFFSSFFFGSGCVGRGTEIFPWSEKKKKTLSAHPLVRSISIRENTGALIRLLAPPSALCTLGSPLFSPVFFERFPRKRHRDVASVKRLPTKQLRCTADADYQDARVSIDKQRDKRQPNNIKGHERQLRLVSPQRTFIFWTRSSTRCTPERARFRPDA